MGIVIKNNSLNNNGGIAINNNNVEGISYQNKTIYKKEEQANIEIITMEQQDPRFQTWPGVLEIRWRDYYTDTYFIENVKRFVGQNNSYNNYYWINVSEYPDAYWLISTVDLDNNKNFLADLNNYYNGGEGSPHPTGYVSGDYIYCYVISKRDTNITRVYKNVYHYDASAGEL